MRSRIINGDQSLLLLRGERRATACFIQRSPNRQVNGGGRVNEVNATVLIGQLAMTLIVI